MRVLFFGMRCIFSPPVLAALVTAGHDIAAIITPGPAGAPAFVWSRRPGSRIVPLSSSPEGLDGIAASRQIPIGQLANPRDPSAIRTFAALAPDVIVVACFPRLLPEGLIEVAPKGNFNLHPSRLPALRGPEPIFWALRNGLTETAVTAHRLSDRFDAGEIYGQEPFTMPFGARIGEIEAQMAHLGGSLALRVLAAMESKHFHTRPQCDNEATYAPFPTMHDFTIQNSWSALRAYAFIRGVATDARPVIVDLGNGEKIAARDATKWLPERHRSSCGASADDEIDLAFADGVVRVRR